MFVSGEIIRPFFDASSALSKKSSKKILLTFYNYKTIYVVMKTQHIKILPKSWEPAAQVFAALGDPTRQKILLLFEKDEALCIKTIAELFDISRTSIVYHLGVLERAEILQVTRKGKQAFYSLNHHIVLEAIARLQDYIQTEFVK